MLGLNDMSTLVLSPTERKKRDRSNSRGEIVEEMKERDKGERKMNDSKETEEIKTFPL